jgi:hypothetical protein
MKKWIRNFQKVLNLYTIFVLYCITMTSCAMVTQDKLPKYSYSQIPQSQLKVSIDYDFKDNILLGGGVYFHKVVEKVFFESHVFNEVYQGVGNERYHMSIKFEDYTTNVVVWFINLELSACSLTLIPMYNSCNYVMTIDVSKDGNIIKTYKYDDGYSLWLQLFLIVWPDTRSQEDIQTEVMSNIARNFLHDLQKDAILQ